VLLDPGFQHNACLVSDAAGGTFTAWQQKENGVYRIYVRRFDSSAAPAWPAVAVCTSTGQQLMPMMVSDGAGGVVVSWADLRRGLFEADTYAQRVSAAGARVWPDSGVAVCAARGPQYYESIIASTAGSVVVTWMDLRAGAFDIYAQRISSAGVPLWAANGTAICTAVGSQEFSDDAARTIMVSDGTGGAVIGWWDQRSGGYDVYVQRVDVNGAVQWTLDGVALCTATGDQKHVVLGPDGTGGAIAAWEDGRNVGAVYARRINSAGVPQWAADGVALSGTGRQRAKPYAIYDGAGGAIVAWNEWPGYWADIYAQRVNASGAVQWGASGVAVCAAVGEQRNPQVASDGGNGAVILWMDCRSGSGTPAADLYAQRLAATGLPQWGADGVPVCTAPDYQGYPAVLAGAAGSVVTAWQDRRLGTADFIRFQGIDVAGALRWSEPSVTAVGPAEAGLGPGAELAIQRLQPNPAVDELRLEIRLTVARVARVDLLDVSGRRLRRWTVEPTNAGTQQLSLLLGRDLAPGVYLVQLTQGANTVTRRVCIVH